MPETSGYTPIQTRILAVLSDGAAHPKRQLLEAIDPDYPDEVVSLGSHLTILRKRLHDIGQNIMCHFEDGKPFYMLVRRITVDDG